MNNKGLLSTKGVGVRQQFLTVSAGKRLIAIATLRLPAVLKALEEGTVIVLGGSTNGYVAEEFLKTIQEEIPFQKTTFVRGVTVAPKGHGQIMAVGDEVSANIKSEVSSSPTQPYPGDLIIEKGKPSFGKTIFEVVKQLKSGDVVIKGANAFNPVTREAGVLIGHPEMGTIGAAIQAVVGRRVCLVLPVGLEKRVYSSMQDIALCLNGTDATGARFMPVSGELVCELDALKALTGVTAELVAAGGVRGGEGGIWLAYTGTATELEAAEYLLQKVAGEPAWSI